MAITIRMRENGPYVIEVDRNELNIVDHLGNVIPVPAGDPKKFIALCRCGASTNKPFCDRSHSRIGFIAAQRAVEELEGEK